MMELKGIVKKENEKKEKALALFWMFLLLVFGIIIGILSTIIYMAIKSPCK